MSKIYVVVGQSGECSDQITWPVCWRVSLDDARSIAATLTAQANAYREMKALQQHAVDAALTAAGIKHIPFHVEAVPETVRALWTTHEQADAELRTTMLDVSFRSNSRGDNTEYTIWAVDEGCGEYEAICTHPLAYNCTVCAKRACTYCDAEPPPEARSYHYNGECRACVEAARPA